MSKNSIYYKDQLEKVGTEEDYPLSIKIKNIDKETNWFLLNKESANELVKWLTEHYLKE